MAVGLDKSLGEQCVALLLAAGFAKRFGRNKILHAKLDGIPMGLRTAERYQQALPTFVVVRGGDKETKNVFEAAGFETITAERAAEGMGYSLAAGVANIELRAAGSCLIALADMPFVTPATIKKLIQALRDGHQLVRPRHFAKAGHPVGFQRQYFASLKSLSGDQGASSILKTHEAQLTYLDVDDAGVLADIDTQQDLDSASLVSSPRHRSP